MRQVTKSWIIEQREAGKNVQEMVDAINDGLPQAERISVGTFSKNCKKLGVNLRGKLKPPTVAFMDDTVKVVTPQEAFAGETIEATPLA